jgi:tetratricopeptide (TPR) repeat protein
MYRGLVCLLCAAAGMAQAPDKDPIARAIAESSAAHYEARFLDAAAKRESARALLDSVSAASPDFPGSVLAVTQAYTDAGMTARARSVLQHALDRASARDNSQPNRLVLLGIMADSWQQDRNLLKAVAYLEQAAAAQKSPGELSGLYQRLADLYRDLGRSEAMSAMITRIRALPNPGEYSPVGSLEGSQVLLDYDSPLARFFERQGLIEDAVAVYRQDIERAANSHDREPAFLALADFYRRREQYGDAVETLQRAITAAGTAECASLRQSLAGALQRAGRTAEADRVYQDLLGTAPGLPSLVSYAAHLSATDRGAQAEQILKDYQSSHQGLEADQADVLLYAMAEAANASGAKERGGEYLGATSGLRLFMDHLPAAESDAPVVKADDAFDVASRAIEQASTAAEIATVVSTVSTAASTLASKAEGAKAEQLYQKLVALTENRSQDTLLPLLDVAREYATFLISQPDRWSAAANAIARYRDLLTRAHGAESGILEEAIALSMDFEIARESPRAALAAAQELLFLQESLNGNTSEPYLQTINRVAGVFERNGDPARSRALHRQAVRIADLVYIAADTSRGTVRIEAAFAFARQEQFDEADRFAREAVAIGQAAGPPFNEQFSRQLEQIRDMRSAHD